MLDHTLPAPKDIRHPAVDYIIAAASIVAALALRGLLDPLLGDTLPFVTFFVALTVLAWYVGAKPALFATFIGYLTAHYCFVQPRFSFTFQTLEQVVGLAMYMVIGISLTGFSGAMRLAKDRAEKNAADANDRKQRLELEMAVRARAQAELQKLTDELEERVLERTRALSEANLALERSNRELEQFASVASHDLQEPLRKIQAFGDRLQTRCKDEIGDQGREYMERILASAARMRTLINDLLTFSRVTTKALPFSEVHLTAIANEVVADLEGRIQQSGGTVDVGELPVIEADPLQMRQLLQNLLGNALKFHRQDVPPVVKLSGRIVEVETEVSTEIGPTAVEIRVEDNGIGFEETYLDRIFELFQRLHGRNEYEGTGMGLAICRKIVERHGGSITARSHPDAGATFLITLPIKQQSENQTA